MSQYQISDLFINETGSSQYQVGGLFINETAAPDTDIFLSATSTLVLDQDVAYTAELGRPAESTLTFTQTVGLIRDFGVDAESILSLTDEATGTTFNEYDLDAESILTLTDEAVGTLGVEYELSAESELELDQDVSTAESIYNRSVLHVMTGLDDEAVPTVDRNRSATSPLTLAQSATVSIIPAAGIDLAAESVLSLDHDVAITPTGDGESVLTLTQSATGVASRTVSNTLTLSQVAGLSIERATVPAESELTLTQSVAFVIERAVEDFCDYAPFIGGGPMPPEMIGPTPGVTARFALIYPATGSPTDTVELRAPNLGNRHRLTFDRIVDETRGGTLIVYADPIWPKVQTLAVNFSALKRAEANELIRFMREHNGEEIKLTDWEQRVWRGVITTPGDPIIQDGRTSFTASFEFEGELVPIP